MRTRLWFALLLGVSCTDPVGPDIEHLDVTVQASAIDMVAGDVVEFRVLAHNPTNRTLRFSTNACVLVVRLLDYRGFPVFESPSACNDIGLVHELAPGGFLEESILFDGTTSWGPFLDASGSEAYYTLAPGLYQVVGGVSSNFLSTSPALDLRIRASE